MHTNTHGVGRRCIQKNFMDIQIAIHLKCMLDATHYLIMHHYEVTIT